MWVDTHCHLDAPEFDQDRDSVVQQAVAAGMVCCVVPAVSARTFPWLRNCCQRFPPCVPAYGIHPMFVNEAQSRDLAVLEQYLREARPVAVGEIGLDGTVVEQPGLDWQTQKSWFAAQLTLAQRFNLPVILHVRKAIDEVCHLLRQIPVKGGIAHAFNGSRQQADQLIKLGFKLGFGGAMTYPGSTRIRKLAAEIPLSAIVLETDAPDIPPVWLNQNGLRARNEPGELPAIAQTLADLRKLPLSEIMAITTDNAKNIFGRHLACRISN